MSDTEEPPTKVAKFEMSQTFTQPEEMDVTLEEGQENGQEEWLSEGLLTDDDTADNQDNSATQLQDTTAESIEATAVRESNAKIDAKIEKTLNSMGSQSGQANDLFDALLKQDQNDKKEESDGNDTDDLLRMLEDDDKSKKAKVLTKTKPKEQPVNQNASSDEDDGAFIYQGTTVKKVKVAKNAVQKYPTKATPETTDDDETDASTEEVQMMMKMFGANKPSQNSQAKPAQAQPLPQIKKQFMPKKVVRIGNTNTFKQVAEKRPPASSTPLPRPAQSLLKTSLQQGKTVTPLPPGVKLALDRWQKPEVKKSQPEHDEIINEEEFLEEDGFDLDEDFAAESDTELEKRKVKQRIMKPEQMDEDMMSDGDSDTEGDSMYDELPSSDSDEMDDWFTLDIRSERAGDYLPLLGTKAYDLLTQEKVRVGTHLASLRQSLASLSAGSRQQADQLKAASRSLAEIDDALKAH